MNPESAEHEARLKLVEEHLRAENDHDLDALMATFGQDAKFNLNGMPLNDRESIRAMYGMFGFGGQGSFSDLKAETMQVHFGEKSIVVELMLSGKHTNDFQGIAPTNREFKLPACAIFDFDAEGTLAGERVYFDGASLLGQLGVL
jgi:hypothetical protein